MKLESALSRQILKDYDHRRDAIIRNMLDKREKATERQSKKSQRLKYNVGAAKSPTPPPAKSLKRDAKALKVLGLIEYDATASGSILVKGMVEKYLFEQGLIDESKLTGPVYRQEDLFADAYAALAKDDFKLAKKLQARQSARLAFQKSPAQLYHWDKTTSLLKSAFYAWSMPQANTRPFTLLLSKEVVERAKAAKTSVVSHLSDRLKRLLKTRHLGDSEYWFILEFASSVDYHIHGAISWPTNNADQELVKSALLTLSGGTARDTLKISENGPRMGWAAYCQKHHASSSYGLKGSTLTGSISVLRRAKLRYGEFYEEYRARLGS